MHNLERYTLTDIVGLADERNGDDERGQGIEDCLQEEQADLVSNEIYHL